MNRIVELLTNNININSLDNFSNTGFFKVILSIDEEYRESYLLNIDCSFIIGFYSSNNSCEFDLVIEDINNFNTIFHYVINRNILFYAIDDKFIIPCTKLYNSKVYIKNFIGNPRNLSIIKNNIAIEDKIYMNNNLIYCKLHRDKYLLYDDGRCFIQDYLTLDRKTDLYNELINIKVYNFSKEQDSTTYLIYHKEPVYYIKPSINFFQSMYIFLVGS